MGIMNLQEVITKRINDIPLLSTVASRLMTIAGDENSSLKDIVKIVEMDSYLTARILKLANSAAFYRGRPVSTLAQAIVLLGERVIIGIAVGSCSTIFNRPLDGYQGAAGDLWAHSLHCAIASREVAKLAGPNISPDLAFTAGLLHDIGKPIISDLFAQKTEQMASWCDRHQVKDFLEAERDIIGTDHAEVGYSLARHWKLPDPLRIVVRYHHHPNLADIGYRKLAYVVHLADIIAMMEGAGTGADSLSYRVEPGYSHYIPINKDDFARILLITQQEFQTARKLIFVGEEVKACSR